MKDKPLNLKLSDAKLTPTRQRNLFIALVFYNFLIIYLFNIFWEPIIFLLVGGYFILNDRVLTRKEMVIIMFVKLLVFYACLARIFGIDTALFIVSIPAIVIAIIYLTLWRNEKP